MRPTPDDYMQAAEERLRAGQLLYQQCQGHYVDALYLCGVAVECVLRAFGHELGSDFIGRHDLPQLAGPAVVERIVGSSREQRLKFTAALGDVWARWKNNYRYVPRARVEAELRKLQLHRGIDGDFVKENARVALEGATLIVNRGKYRWTLKS